MEDLQATLSAIADNNSTEKIYEREVLRERQCLAQEQKELVAWLKNFIIKYAPYNYHVLENGKRRFSFEMSFYCSKTVIIDLLPDSGTFDFGADLNECFNRTVVPKCIIEGSQTTISAEPWIRSTLFKPMFNYTIKHHWFSESQLIVQEPITERTVDINRFLNMAQHALGDGVSVVSCPPIIKQQRLYDNKPEQKTVISATKIFRFTVLF